MVCGGRRHVLSFYVIRMLFVKHRPQPDARQTAESKDIVKGIGDKGDPEYFPIRNVEAKRPFQHKVIKGLL